MYNNNVLLFHGDCLDKMKDIADESIDMVLCDLPYGTTACKWDSIIPFKPLWGQYMRIIKEHGTIVLFGSEPFSSKLRMSNIDWYKYDWIWEKNRPTNFFQCKSQPLRNYENISIFYNKKNLYHPQDTIKCNIKSGRKNKGGKIYQKYNGGDYIQTIGNYPRQILKFNSVSDNGKYHPTQKPVALLEYLIRTYSNENELVLDNTAGSMSTAIAAINTKRKCICIEKDDKYFKIGSERVEKRLKEIREDLFNG